MKSVRVLLTISLCAFIVGVLAFYVYHFITDDDSASETATRVQPSFATESQPISIEKVDMPDQAEETINYPENAIPGEVTLHFKTRDAYLAYLRDLSSLGGAPLGQIDELLVLRVKADAIFKLNPIEYEATPGFSYQVVRPQPPTEISPKALASLRGFGRTARGITGGVVDGDGQGVMVAILDSGITAHPQFDDVYIVNIDLVGTGVSSKGAAHGTSVASIIAGSEGIAPEAELFVVRVLDDQGLGNSFHVAEGIVQAVDLGVKVINMSLGVYQDSSALRQAVDYATERSVILVAAAGNDGYQSMPFPAAYSDVLAVTATDASGRQALFPNQSDKIDIAAPGVAIVTANEEQGTVLFSGTSAAAPFVSGTLAALISAEPTRAPKETVALIKRFLNDAGAPGVDPVYGAGTLDWRRLRERNINGIIDIAIADIYLSSEAVPGTTMPILVTVQNRGTQWTPESQMEVMIGEAQPLTFIVGPISPGQITTRKVFTQVPSLQSDETLSIAARVLPENVTADTRLENNLKLVFFRPNR